jgi:hypothetical protein
MADIVRPNSDLELLEEDLLSLFYDLEDIEELLLFSY